MILCRANNERYLINTQTLPVNDETADKSDRKGKHFFSDYELQGTMVNFLYPCPFGFSLAESREGLEEPY